MLFDRYVSALPQADEARKALGAAEVVEIETYIETGGTTNITVSVELEKPEVVAIPEQEIAPTATTTEAPVSAEVAE